MAAALLLVAGGTWFGLKGTRPKSPKARPAFVALVVTVHGPKPGPATGASVRLVASGQPTALATDAGGRARFSRVKPGKVELTVQAKGAARWFQMLAVTASTKSLAVTLRPGAELAGLVVDDAGAPIAKARLLARPLAPPEQAFEAETDPQGQFRVSELESGQKYALEVNAPHHELSVLPHVAAPAEGLRVVLQRTSSLVGEVLNGAGEPAAGATVRIAGSGIWPARELTSDAGGRFALEKLSGGVYELRAQLGTFTSAPEEGVLIAPASEAFVRLRLEPGVTLRGRVLDAQTRSPLAQARVVVTEDALSSVPITRNAENDGRFLVEGLRALRHRVWVTAGGYVPVAGESHVAGGAPVEFLLTRSATLAGVVLDERGAPVAQAVIEVIGTTETGEPMRVIPEVPGLGATSTTATPPPPGDNLGVTSSAVPRIPLVPGSEPAALSPALQTDDAGRFELTSVPPGQAQLLVQRAGYAPVRSTVLRLQAGERVQDLKLVLSRGALVAGRVKDGRGFPVAGIRVELSSRVDPLPRVTVSREDGSFHFESVPLGSTTVRALPLREAVVERRVELTAERGPEVLLELLSESRALAGRVVDARGFAVEAAVVRVQSEGAHSVTVRSTVSATDGTFEVSGLPAPPFVVYVEHPSYASAREVSQVPHQQITVALRAGTHVSGLVHDEKRSEGLGSVIVSLRGGPRRELRSARTTARGAFEFRNLTPDEYEIIVSHDGFVPARFWFTVEGGKPLELPAIKLLAAGSVSGEVVDQLGAPVRNAEVALGEESSFGGAVRTDHVGRFRVTGVAPGDRWVWARHGRAGQLAQAVPVRVYPEQESPGLILRLPSAQ